MIEFILGLMVVISFFFFYVKMCAVFAAGNYVHYATFMSARAYASSAADPATQTSNADSVINAMLSKRFKSFIKGTGGDGSSTLTGATIGPGSYYQDTPTQDVWNQGTTFHYTAKLALLPWSKDDQSIAIDLTSESWMPREDTINECNAKKNAVAGLISATGLQNITVEWDNGC